MVEHIYFTKKVYETGYYSTVHTLHYFLERDRSNVKIFINFVFRNNCFLSVAILLLKWEREF
jgi:hypothetical protein